MGMEHYIFDETAYAEQFNTLIIIDDIFKKSKLRETVKPKFIIVGGTAILFHGIEAVVTVDIDCANKLDNSVKEICGELVTDMASEVICFPKNYMSRAVQFEENKFEFISIILPSIEDIVITKLHAGRTKDMHDLSKYSMLKRCDRGKLEDIINNEMPDDLKEILMRRLKELS